MVFKELETVRPEFIRFGRCGNITISVSLIKKFWKSLYTHVQIFHDEENRKIGFKPSKDKGYKLFVSGGGWRITSRAFVKKMGPQIFNKPEWNEKHGMLIVQYDVPKEN